MIMRELTVELKLKSGISPELNGIILADLQSKIDLSKTFIKTFFLRKIKFFREVNFQNRSR